MDRQDLHGIGDVMGSPAPALSILNPNPKRLPGPSLLHELVSDSSAPGELAIDYRAPDGSRVRLSYAELHSQAERLARRIAAAILHRQGLGQFVIPLLLPQSPLLYISQLAVLKAGGAFCPLNLDAPSERVRFILGDVNANVIVTSTALRPKVDSLGLDVRVLEVDDAKVQHDQVHLDAISQNTTPHSLAYVMYTSGSTGTPKGVGISHGAATQALLAHDRHVPHFSRFLQFAAPTFDVSVFEIFFPLFRGSTLVCCSRAEMLNDLPAVLREMQVDACELTPTVAGSLLRSRANAPQLSLLLTIGEMLTVPVIREFGGDENKPSILWAMYGPTEATIHCTLQPSCEASLSVHNVGFPLDTVSAFILEPLADDKSSGFRVVPLGETGELAIGGNQTAVGYINRAEQTTQVFIETPYGRLYRTGDKARILEDGTIECFGRISDGQVKLRGQRIELGEIEQAALRTSGCLGAVAAVIQGIIVVFCEQDAPGDAFTEDLLHTCRKWLPAFMIPGDVVFQKAFPRLPSGKVDRKQLKTDYETTKKSTTTGSMREWRDDNEREIAQLVYDAMGIELKSSSVLNAAGIDSLAAIKLASRLRQAGLTVTAIDVLNSNTLSDLRSRIRRERSRADSAVGIDDHPPDTKSSGIDIMKSLRGLLGPQEDFDAVVAVFPCSPTQVSMLAETLSNQEAYCNWIEVEILGGHSDDIIVSWFQQLAQHNEILRTGFVSIEGVYRQVVWDKLHASQIRVVKALTRSFRLDEAALARPFSVQVIGSQPRKTSVLLQIHHALYDGWSFDILMNDLNVLEKGGHLNKRPAFHLVSNYYQSAEFLLDAEAARAYWAEHLLGYQPTSMPQLLAKQSTSGQTSSAGCILDVNASTLQTVSAQLDASLQVLFQACVLWLWGSIMGTDDVVIGTVTSGRTIPVQGIEDVMGPCLTTIPLRSKLQQVRTIRELIESIHTSNRESLAHCMLPLSEIKKAAGITPGQPIYDVLYVYQESLHSRFKRQQPADVNKIAHQDHLETNLVVEIEPMGDKFRLLITYHIDAFQDEHIKLFLRQFDCVLGYITSNLDCEMSSIVGCFADDLVSQHNLAITPFKGSPDLAALFEKMADEGPDRHALCFAKSVENDWADLDHVSYGELNRLANKIARHIQVSGAVEGAAVAIIMEKSILLYAGILGILKAGCAYLPLLPSTPPSRVSTVLDQAKVRLCLTDDTNRDDLPVIQNCVFVNLREADLRGYNDKNLEIAVNPSTIANIVYTSGSTGVPKGVSVTQLNITSNLDVLSKIYPVEKNSRMLQTCSQAFDVSVFEIFFALTRGICLCAATNDVLFADLERSIRAMDVTHLSMTPTVASLVNPESVPQVEFLVTSGEPMTTEVARRWMGKLYQGYGPSETTNICSVKKMSQEDHIRHLGHTLMNTSALVLARDGLDPVPIGCLGEFCFGGDQVVAGYLNMPHITQEKFIEHPKYGRIYRSGDIGRMLADGSLLIVGRIDDQVKLRGQRIELGEVAAVVALSNEVSNCAAILVNNEQQLACFYVPRSAKGDEFKSLPVDDGTVKMGDSIFRTLESRLPGYMIPSYLIPISAIPMTSSGKIDKSNLRGLFSKLGSTELEAFGATAESRDVDGDWSDQERKVATVVANALGARPQDVGRWTPLTSLGLDSITAISVGKGLQCAFSRKVPISAILQNSSTAKLAALLPRCSAMATNSEGRLDAFPSEFADMIRRSVSSKNFETEAILPCTPLQQAMLAASVTDGSYLNKMLFRLNIDATLMRRYWGAMFWRHPILRTTFFSTSNREHAVAQCVLKAWEPDWLTFDTSTNSLDDAISRHTENLPDAVDSCIPPVSLATIRHGSNTYLSFVCHHALYDGVAISRLLEEIEQIAAGRELSRPPSYEPFLQEALNLPTSTDEFWRAHLKGLEPKPFPHSIETESGRGILKIPLEIPLKTIEKRLKLLNVSILSLLQAAWSSFLRIIQKSDDICFGNVINGRTSTVERIEELVAPCFNTIPAHIQFHDKRRNIDILKYFHVLNPELLKYQFTPLRRIQALNSKGLKLFDTLLLLQQPPKILNESIWTLERDDGDMNFPLVCEATPMADGAAGVLEVKLHFDRTCVSDAFALFAYDTLSHIISTFLDFPSSHALSKEGLPSQLRERMDRLGLVDPARNNKPDLPDTSDDEWSDPERAVRAVLSDISKIDETNITHRMTIYQLGLDSINAVQVAAMLRNAGFAGATAMDVLENPTCSKLAAKLSTHHPAGTGSSEYDLAAFECAAKSLLDNTISNWEPVQAVFPCTPIQTAMLSQFMNSNGKDYFNFITFKFDEHFEVSEVKKAWKRLVEVHPVLRSGFIPIDHEDASFAMLQYIPEENKLPCTIQYDPTCFRTQEWQLDASKRAFKSLREPPWEVVLVPSSKGFEMHLAIHHAIYDAYSLQVILDDLGKLIRGEPIKAGRDLASVIHSIITQTQKSKDEAAEFWTEQAPEAVVNSFPIMTPLREAHGSILVRQRACTLSFTDLTNKVRHEGFTIQAVAQAAWLRVLSSYIGEESVIFGTISASRNTDATQDAVFPCITTLPVIIRNSASNRDLLQAMMDYNRGLQRHQRTPLTDIQKWLGHSNTRLFDTLLVYQKFDGEEKQSKPWTVIDENTAVDYPVSIEIAPDHDVLQLRVTFSNKVLPAEQAYILLKQFDAVFCDLAQHPDGCEDDVLESHPELLAVIPAEQPELPSDLTLLHGFVESSAAKYPERIALEFVSSFEDNRPISQQWTYKELDENGNRVANILSLHVKTGDIVAICFDKSPEAHFAMLGILKAGCALLALDPGAPPSRKEFILQDSGASVVLTDKSRSMDLGLEVAVPIVTIDGDDIVQFDASRPKLSRRVAPADTSYCLYTSGTTGTPKGCEITHENAVQAMLGFQHLFEGHWDQDSKWLQFASYHFDVSVLEQYWTWSVGITLVVAPRDVILEDLAGTISRLEITHIDLTPSLARLLHPDDVPSLCRGVFITGGEQLKQEILDVWGPKRVIHNFYGPTEATIGVTSYPCVPVNGRSSNIGRQFPNVGSYVLRPNTETPVLRGGVGELCVSGKLVGKGYLNRADLTAERFPTLKGSKERVYRTGDLVRVLHNGCFDFLGRADDQVKLRGQRLEIGEINHCIRSTISDITDVVTLVVRNEKHQKDLLVSFVVTEQEDVQKPKDLRIITGDYATGLSQNVKRACRDRLPGYMVPTYVIVLPFIPLSPNNKAEARKLRTLFNSLSPEQLATPSHIVNDDLGEAAKKVCKALSSMAGVQEDLISFSTNTFELGVDSISVMKLTRALKLEGLSRANPAVILRNPIVADLVYALQSLQQSSEVSTGMLEASQAIEALQHKHKGFVCRRLNVSPDNIEYVAPCSPLQHGMISRSQTDGNWGSYFTTFRYELAAGLDLEKLRSAWRSLVQKHAILRTKFVSTTDGYVQVATKQHTIPWEELPLQQDGHLDMELAERRQSWIGSNSVDIDKPLKLLTVSGTHRRQLVVHIFHGIYDATSFDLMVDEVARLYNGKEGSKVTAPSFLDALIHGPLRNHSFCRNFWLEHLQGVSLQPLPQLSQDPSGEDLCVTRSVQFQSLDKLGKTMGVTQQAIIQALWGSVLQRYCVSGVTFGIIVSGRSIELENIDRTIGPLFNTVPYHHRIREGQTWSSTIRNCHEFNTAILPFQHVPLRDIQKWCSGGKPIFDTLFSFQQASTAKKAGVELWSEVESNVNPDFPLAFEATLLPDGLLQVLIATKKGVSNEKVLEKMIDEFETMAKAVVVDLEGLVLPGAADGLVGKPRNGLDGPDVEVNLAQSLKSTQNPPTFEWSHQAKKIRREMAVLAETEESSISQRTTLLELGLDSIDTIKLSARLRRVGVTLSNSELIKGQSIENFEEILRSNGVKRDVIHDSGYSSDVEDSSISLKTHLTKRGLDLSNVELVLPPTPLQDSMVSEMVQSGFQRYFNHDVLELAPNADIQRLKHAWATVIENSPILRTVFVEVDSPDFDSAYAQLVMKDYSITDREIEVNSPNDLLSVMEQARLEAQKGQGQSNLLQVTFATSNHKNYAVLSIAHALYDGWSLGLLHGDVEAAYDGNYMPRQPYTDCLHRMLRSLKQDAKDFWSDYLSGAVPVQFPSHGQEEAGARVNRAEVVLPIPASALKQFCRFHTVSQQVVAQACWAIVLATHCKRLDVTFGVVLSGRETQDSAEVLFPTMNTVPVRAVLHGSVIGFLQYMQDNMTGVRKFQNFPLRKIQALIQDRRAPLFNTLFIMQKNSVEAAGTSRAEDSRALMKSIDGSSAVEFPVCVEMEISGNDIIWRTACDDRYLSGDSTHDLLDELRQVLEYLINSPDKDTLQFSEDGVSACSLPSFKPQEMKALDVVDRGLEQVRSLDQEDEWSDTEKAIREVLAGMSGVEQGSIRKYHNLYHLGLDSISAIKVSAALRKRGVIVSVRDMTRAASITEMATNISKNPVARSDDVTDTRGQHSLQKSGGIPDDIRPDNLLDSARIDPRDAQEILPATAMQTHMLSVWQNTHGAVFFPEFRYRVSGVADREAIDAAWRSLIQRNPMLRTVFVATGRRSIPFLQVVLSEKARVENPFVTLQSQPDESGNWVLRLKIHHALYDGVSLPLIMGYFKRLLIQGVRADWQGNGLTQWGMLISSSLGDRAQRNRRAFWTQYLDGAKAPPLNFPHASNAPSNKRINFLKPSAVKDTGGIRALCSRHGFSIQSAFLAAYAKILATLSGLDDVVFGVYIANRGAEHDLLYPTLCLVPLRVRVPNPFDIAKVAGSIQRDIFEISKPENLFVGLWEIKDWTSVVVETFVNFLSLPEDASFEGKDESGIGLEAVLSAEMAMNSVGDEHTTAVPKKLSWLENNPVRDAYPDAVDVEVSMKEGGAMDIGVFGNYGMLGGHGAQDLVQMAVDTMSM